jgi:UDP-N-acetylmuramate dehydrogenase
MTTAQALSDSFSRELVAAFGAARVAEHAPLAPLTTFQVGGPADLLFEPEDEAELVQAWRLAHAHHLPVTLLGGGSNVLVGDRGVRGLVLRVRRGGAEALPTSAVRASAGITINGLVRFTVAHGLAGLEAWAGTPGTVGGAIYGNAHFEGRLIGERVRCVRVVSRAGEIAELGRAEMEFAYDASRLQRTGELLLSADFDVQPGEPASLRARARDSLAYRKRTQPLAAASAGCIFRNPDGQDTSRFGLPASAGALIDAAGLKGHAIGGARISPLHANFFVNEAGARASDVAALIELSRARVRERFGIELQEEIVRLGEFR